MSYVSFSLNGPWEMSYSETAYTGTENPWKEGFLIEKAVPGYWEDMTDAFAMAPFYCKLRVNPEFGTQRYPIAGTAPDMALPNYYGNFFYRRTFLWTECDYPVSIHFEGVQNTVSVWVNDQYIGHHEGFSAPFEMKIPEGLLQDGENTVVLSVSNFHLLGYEGEIYSGLNCRAGNECTGGVTGDVELRAYVCPLRDINLFVAEDLSRVDVKVISEGDVSIEWTVSGKDGLLKSGTASGDFSFDTEGMALWTPEEPNLYEIEVRCGEGSITRPVGVRRLTVDGVRVLLNGVPCYLRGACEHGFFAETVHPAHDSAFYRKVIRSLKELGFNFIRFHTAVPEEEYLRAADELGMLMEVESPSNTTYEEWKLIVQFARRHPSVIMYSCGNELLIDEAFLAHMEKCAAIVHEGTDALFSPMSALRGVEYCWDWSNFGDNVCRDPYPHNPSRFEIISRFSDLYNSYTLGRNSYNSLDADPAKVDSWSYLYNKPRLSHEIGIHGTYTDLSLWDRYNGLNVGKTDMLPSLKRHLTAKGVIRKAPLYFRNSVQWQRRLRKHCFESTRLSDTIAGYDFLGPIDTHWHTFGYDCGLMNEFFEIKPGETKRNVLMYNSATVLLNDLGTDVNFFAGEELAFALSVSHYGPESLKDALLTIRLTLNGKLIESRRIALETVENGRITCLHDFRATLPEVKTPGAMKLYAVLEGGDTWAENEWELYLFPKTDAPVVPENLLVADQLTEDELIAALKDGRDVLLFGAQPFAHLSTSFQIALSGRTSGNLATVIADHPAMQDMPNEGFCGWQFRRLMEKGAAVCFEDDSVPFDPIVEVVSSHKYVIRQAALFEFNVLGGRLLVCSFRFDEDDPAACWLKNHLISYAAGEAFSPAHTITVSQLSALIHGKVAKIEGNNNRAFNPNDKAANRRKKN